MRCWEFEAEQPSSIEVRPVSHSLSSKVTGREGQHGHSHTKPKNKRTSWLRAWAFPAASFAAVGGQRLPKEGNRRRVLCTQDLILEMRESIPQARLVITPVPGCWLGWASGQLAPDSSCARPPHKTSGCYALHPSPTCPACQLGQASPLVLTSGHPHFMTWQNGNSNSKNLVGQLQGAMWQAHLGVPAMGLGRWGPKSSI